MADVSMSDFLLQYYMQLRFNEMPPEVRAQYDTYAKSDDFRGNMKEWKKRLMHDAGGGKYVQNDLPNPNDDKGDYHLTDDEWEKLFKAYQTALRGMDAALANGDEALKENGDAKNFIHEYFGDSATHLFSYATADPQYLPDINALKTAFDTYPQLEYVLTGYTDISFSDLKKGIASKKYNTDPNFQSKLIKIAGFLEWKVSEDGNVANMLSGINLDNIARRAFADNVIDPAKLANFKHNHQEMLNILYKKDKIFNVFRNFDSGKISGRIAAARDKLKYDDKTSDDYVPPKRDDELTPLQQLSRWADDTYDNLLDKYLKFHGDRLYFSKNAENIIKAINGAKVKPTDGIDGVLKKADDIKKNLLYKSPTATKHFDWFTKTLGEMRDTMKKAFAGALKNGRQMRAIVSEIIMKAVREGKIEEAKTTLEVLSVIKYGATTSKVMDAFKKENLTIFSDGKLSWNKNEGVKFVSTALDKSIKFAFMGVGYGITIIGNEIRLSGSKFNGNRGRIKDAQNAWKDQNQQEQKSKAEETNKRNLADTVQINVQQQRQTTANSAGTVITDKNYGDLLKANQQEQKRLTDLFQSQKYQDAYQNVHRADELNYTIQDLHNQIQTLNDQKTKIEQMLSNPGTFNGLPNASADAMATQLATRLQEIDSQLGPLLDQEHDANQELNNIKTNPDWSNQVQTLSDYDKARSLADTEAARLSEWHSATETIKELNDQIKKRNAELDKWDTNHKDQYKELMAYWDMLETGRDSHMGAMYNWLPRSKKTAQDSFNQNKSELISNYLKSYSYAS